MTTTGIDDAVEQETPRTLGALTRFPSDGAASGAITLAVATADATRFGIVWFDDAIAQTSAVWESGAGSPLPTVEIDPATGHILVLTQDHGDVDVLVAEASARHDTPGSVAASWIVEPDGSILGRLARALTAARLGRVSQ